jgi:hypothetical protein
LKRKDNRRSEGSQNFRRLDAAELLRGIDIEGESVNGEKGQRPTMDPGRDMIQHVGGSPIMGDILLGILIILLIIYFWASTG